MTNEPAASPRVKPRTGSPLVLVLTYHAIAAGPSPLHVAPGRLEADLDRLTRAGYRAIPLERVVAYLRREPAGRPRSPLPLRAFALTFDDGYADFTTQALPILERRSLPATLFVTAAEDRSRLPGGAPRPLVALDELRTIAGRGVEIGAHGLDHVDLTTLDDPTLDDALRRCRAVLEDHAGRAVRLFAYPFGRHDARVRAAVGSCYDGACTTRLAAVRPADDRLTVPRLDAYYLGSPWLRLLIARGRPGPYLRLRRTLRLLRGTERSI